MDRLNALILLMAREVVECFSGTVAVTGGLLTFTDAEVVWADKTAGWTSANEISF